MMHKNRRWTIKEVASAEELAHKLVDYTWCVCSGFSVAGHPDIVFLNDSTGGDGAQEYAVCRRETDGQWYQIESITFGWCKLDQALGYVREMLSMSPAARLAALVATTMGPVGRAALGAPASTPAMHALVHPRIETREEHFVVIDGQKTTHRPMCCA